MPEPQETVEPQTAPAVEVPQEAQSEPTETQETATLTRDEVKALIEETWADRETTIRKEIEQTYKTLRRGEAKSDVSLKRIDKLETELFDISLRGLDPQAVEIEKLKRQAQRADSNVPDPNSEASAFQGWATPYLEGEAINSEDPVLKASFQKHAEGWQNAADLRVALTRAVADVHKDAAKKAKSESADREKKAREDERAKLRNEKRQEDGKIDKGTVAGKATGTPKNLMALSPEEWETLKLQKGIKG